MDANRVGRHVDLASQVILGRKVVSRIDCHFSIENLLILTSYYHGYSPEASNASGALGFDYGGYPSARTFTLGVNINF